MPKTNSQKRRRPSLCLVLALTLLALMPAAAQAAVGAGMSISFPPTVTVGQSGLPASLTLQNQNTGEELTRTNTVCNADDSAGMCSGDPGIVLLPSCGALEDGRCTVPEPGVFGFPATASGRAGTSCAGMTFAIEALDPAFGIVRFTPAGGDHVTLPRIVPGCAIDFTLSVLRSPTADSDPATAGVQTAHAAEHTQYADGVSRIRVRDSGASTVQPAPPPSVTPAPGQGASGPGPALAVAVSDRDRDGTSDAVDKCPSTAGDKANGCPRNLDADIRGVWRVNGLLSKLVSLVVRAPVGSRIELRCKGPDGACNFRSRVVRKTTKAVTGLTRNFSRPRIFPADTRITVFVTKARRRGTYERVHTRTGRRLPSVVNRCLSARLEVQRCP